MIEIEYKEKEIVEKLYQKLKDIILSNKEKENCKYKKYQHHLYEEDQYPGISKDYFNEEGIIELENINKEKVVIEINRIHRHRHNGYSGLNGNPCLAACIYVVNNEQKKLVWELKVDSGTLHWKAEVTSLEIPKKYLVYEPNNKEIKNPINSNENTNVLESNETIQTTFQKPNELYERYSEAKQKKKQLELEKEEKINQAIQEITSSYSEKLNLCEATINELQEKIQEYNELILRYSTFDEKMIRSSLEQLIKLIENETYQYILVENIFKNTARKDITSMIIAENEYLSSNSNLSEFKQKIEKLIENGEIIVFNKSSSKDLEENKIIFLTMQDNQINFNVNFGKFDYVKEFIIGLIQYRIQNYLENITKEDIINYMQKFLTDNKDTLYKYYVSRIQNKILQLSI